MSVYAMNAVMQSTVEGPVKRSVLLALADGAGEDGYCPVDVPSLVRFTGLGKTTVRRALRELEADEVVTPSGAFTYDGTRTANLSRIDLPMLLGPLAATKPEDRR